MQPSMFYLDFAWSQPPPWSIKAAGYDGVCIYLGSALPDGAYIAQLREVGLAIVLIQEWGETDAYGGYFTGVNMAVQANDRADSIGAPANCVIAYVAADNPYTGDEEVGPLHEWARGVASVGRRGFTLAYGNEAALRFCDPLYWWGVETWSDSRNGRDGWAGKPQLAMLQMANSRTHEVPGYDTDENEVYLGFFGQWGAAPAPTPIPVTRYTEGADMLKFTDQKGTSCEFFTAGTSLFVRYWKEGTMSVPIELSKDVEPSSDLLPISVLDLTLVHVPSHSQPGKIVEAYPSVYGYLGRVV